MYIYILNNKVNNKKYVGKSINQPDKTGGRVYKHLETNSSGCIYLNRAINKYGKENFTYEIIEYKGCTEETLIEIESWHIRKNNSLSPNGYNLKHEGRYYLISDETRLRMSESHKGKKQSAETIKKRSQSLKGRIVSTETRAKISKANMGNKLSKEARDKISKARKGTRLSGEIKRKMSESHKGKKFTPEHRANMSKSKMGDLNPSYGKPHSPEHRAKISKSGKGRKHTPESRKKISEGHKGKKLSDETRKKLSEINKGKKLSEETRAKISEAGKTRGRKIEQKILEYCKIPKHIYDIKKHINSTNVYALVKRLCKDGRLTKFSKGIYKVSTPDSQKVEQLELW